MLKMGQKKKHGIKAMNKMKQKKARSYQSGQRKDEKNSKKVYTKKGKEKKQYQRFKFFDGNCREVVSIFQAQNTRFHFLEMKKKLILFERVVVLQNSII